MTESDRNEKGVTPVENSVSRFIAENPLPYRDKDVPTGNLSFLGVIRLAETMLFHGFKGEVFFLGVNRGAVKYHADQSREASTNPSLGEKYVAESSQRREEFGLKAERVKEIKVLPNGELGLIYDRKKNCLVRLEGKRVLAEERELDQDVQALHFSGNYLIRKRDGQTEVFDLSLGERAKMAGDWGNPPDIGLAEILPDGNFVWNLPSERPVERGYVLWNPKTGKEIARNDSALEPTALLPVLEGRYLLAPYRVRLNGEINIAVYNTQSLELVCRALFPKRKIYGEINQIYTLNSRGEQIVINNGGTLCFFDLSSGEIGPFFSPHREVSIEGNRRITGPLASGGMFLFAPFPRERKIVSWGRERISEVCFLFDGSTFSRNITFDTFRVFEFDSILREASKSSDSPKLNWKAN